MSPSVSVRLLLTQSDERLVELARAGHERAFEALVLRYRRPLLGYCRRLLLPSERAEDALQQGLLQAWLALQGGTEVRDIKPWLYRIVHNAALNMLRRSGYDYAELSEALSGAGAPSEDLDRRIAVRETLAGLAALPEMQREALLRTAVDGSSYQQVAATMGVSEPAVRGLVHRARTTLRTATTALTPSPLLAWALSAGGGDAPLASRLVEAGAGGGSIGLAGILAKVGATAVTAGVLVSGIGTFHQHSYGSAARHRGAEGRHGPPRDGVSGAAATAQAGLELASSNAPGTAGPIGALSPARQPRPRHTGALTVDRVSGKASPPVRRQRALTPSAAVPQSSTPTVSAPQPSIPSAAAPPPSTPTVSVPRPSLPRTASQPTARQPVASQPANSAPLARDGSGGNNGNGQGGVRRESGGGNSGTGPDGTRRDGGAAHGNSGHRGDGTNRRSGSGNGGGHGNGGHDSAGSQTTKPSTTSTSTTGTPTTSTTSTPTTTTTTTNTSTTGAPATSTSPTGTPTTGTPTTSTPTTTSTTGAHGQEKAAPAPTASPGSGAPAHGRKPPPPHGSSSAGKRPAGPVRRGGAGGRSTR